MTDEGVLSGRLAGRETEGAAAGIEGLVASAGAFVTATGVGWTIEGWATGDVAGLLTKASVAKDLCIDRSESVRVVQYAGMRRNMMI